MMPLCRCCQSAPIAHSIYVPSEGMHHLCHACFMRLDARLLREEAAKKLETVALEAMWQIDGSWVREGQVYR